MRTVVQPPPSALPRAVAPEWPPKDAPSGFLPWAAEEAELIIVDKQRRRLSLYRHGVFVKDYPVVLGRDPGRKLHEGDRRTPSGVYRITDKRPSAKYVRFLALDYPNEHDLANYRAERDRGQLPRSARSSPGGLIGIHGSDKEELNAVGINWTFGCVSLRNHDIEELYSTVATGTTVLMFDDQQP